MARIAESIQPSQSEAGRGLMQIRALLWAAGEQNTAVSQSRKRIHSRYVMADTVQSAHSPRSPPRHEGRGGRRDQYDDRFDHDDRCRVPTPPRRGGSYTPRQQDDMRQHSVGRRAPVDPRNQALTRDPSSCKVRSTGTELIEKATTEMRLLAAGYMFRGQSVSVEPSEP